MTKKRDFREIGNALKGVKLRVHSILNKKLEPRPEEIEGWPINTDKYHCIPMPKEWIGQYFNGSCPEPCDMLSGPCACGATHHMNEWIIGRKTLIQGVGWINPSDGSISTKK